MHESARMTQRMAAVARADELRIALAQRYRDLAAELADRAEWLLLADVERMASRGAPVPYLHSRARADEEALDRALMAL